MAIIDLDSHLRDGWLLDEIYQLQDPFKQYTLPNASAMANTFIQSSSISSLPWKTR